MSGYWKTNALISAKISQVENYFCNPPSFVLESFHVQNIIMTVMGVINFASGDRSIHRQYRGNIHTAVVFSFSLSGKLHNLTSRSFLFSRNSDSRFLMK